MSVTLTEPQTTVVTHKTFTVDDTPAGSAITATQNEDYYVVVCNSPTVSSALSLPADLIPAMQELLAALAADQPQAPAADPVE
jgi:hypothetical protein